MRITAVIFDMDGLMFDTERAARTAWRSAMAEEGRSLPDSLYLEVVGRTGSHARTVFRRAMGPDLPIERLCARQEQLLADAIALSGVPVKPGLIDVLGRLERMGIPRAVASSSIRRRVVEMLGLAEVDRWFDVAVGGDEVERGKPDPGIFLMAAQRLGVAPAGCVVLEDSAPGVRAARAAGMTPILVPDLMSPSPAISKMARSVESSLVGAGDLIERLNREG